MKLNLSISFEVEETDPQVEAVLDEIIAEEARGFAETVRQRLAAEGVSDIQMTVSEHPG